MSSKPSEDTAQPVRELSLFDAVCTMVGIMLGPGIFIAPAAVAAVAPDPYMAAGVWLVGGCIALCGAVTYAECASRMPRDGGFFVYYERAFGQRVSQIAGWGAWLVTYPASLTAMSWIAARYLTGLLHLDSSHQTSIAAGLLLSCAALVALGLRLGAWLQRFLTGSKVLIVLAVSVAGVVLGTGVTPAEMPYGGELLPFSPALCLTAFATMMWTFDGWSDITMLAGEIRDPRRNLARTALLGVAIPAVCYALLQLAVLTLLPAAQASRSSYVLLQALEVIAGGWAATCLGWLALICAVGALHGVSTAVSRLGWSMGQAGRLPRTFGVLSPVLGTPVRALSVPVAMALFYLFTNNFNDLMGYFAFTIWIYYALTAGALMRLRRRQVGEAHAWHAPGGVFAPGVVFITAGVMTGLQLFEHPWRTLTGVSVLIVCVAFQALLRLMARRRRPSASAASPDRARA